MKVKHDMNKETGYYQGPDGVFYDFKHNEIFELEFEGIEIRKQPDWRVIGRQYRLRSRIHKNKTMTLIGMSNVIRLGEL